MVFSAGGVVSAMLIPVLLLLFGIAVPLGWVAPPTYAHIGAVLGNPEGSHVLVKFTDYGCTYCRQSIAGIDRLIAADPELKVVVREWPIFDGSEQAARMALAAAAQGKYPAFYHAMFDQGPPSDANVARAAQIAFRRRAQPRHLAGGDVFPTLRRLAPATTPDRERRLLQNPQRPRPRRRSGLERH